MPVSHESTARILPDDAGASFPGLLPVFRSAPVFPFGFSSRGFVPVLSFRGAAGDVPFLKFKSFRWIPIPVLFLSFPFFFFPSICRKPVSVSARQKSVPDPAACIRWAFILTMVGGKRSKARWGPCSGDADQWMRRRGWKRALCFSVRLHALLSRWISLMAHLLTPGFPGSGSTAFFPAPTGRMIDPRESSPRLALRSELASCVVRMDQEFSQVSVHSALLSIWLYLTTARPVCQ